MAIASVNDLLAALGADTRRPVVINKASIANQLAAGYASLWRATGTPGQGSIPAAAAVCDKTLTGALLNFTNAAGAQKVYIARASAVSANSGTTLFIYDRLSHMGGLSGVTTGAQTVNVDASAAGLASRCNQSTYADVEWWAEIYTDIGTTGQTCTVTYTNAANASGQTTTFTLGGASPANRASRIFRIDPGVFIKSVQSVSIGTTTGTAGSWGITARRLLATIPLPLANYGVMVDWAQIGLPLVPNDACLEMCMVTGTTSTGTLTGSVDLVTG